MPFSSWERKEYTYIFVKRTGERTARVWEEKKDSNVRGRKEYEGQACADGEEGTEYAEGDSSRRQRDAVAVAGLVGPRWGVSCARKKRCECCEVHSAFLAFIVDAEK